MAIQDITQFDREDPKYQCCCGCHIKQAVLVVGIIEAVIFVGAAGILFKMLILGLWGPIFWTAFGIVATIFLFVGYSNEDGRMLIPSIVFLIIQCIGVGIIGFMIIAWGATCSSVIHRYAHFGFGTSASAICGLMLFLGILFLTEVGITIYFIVLLFRGYSFFEAARQFKETPVPIESMKKKKDDSDDSDGKRKKRKKRRKEKEDDDSESDEKKKKKKKEKYDEESENKNKKKRKKEKKDDDSESDKKKESKKKEKEDDESGNKKKNKKKDSDEDS